MEEEVLVSIIVPIFNSERYLDECVSSLVSQSWKDIEIILVDDGSTDSSYQKCLEWAERDCRIKCATKSNGGISSARNVGLAMATGSFYCYVDSDDFIDSGMVETMMGILDEKPECGLVISRVYAYYEDKGDKLLDSFPFNRVYDDTYISEYQYFKDILSWKVENFACAKLFRREYAQIRFKEGRSNEDFMYSFQNAANNHISYNKFTLVGVAGECFYHYRQHLSFNPNFTFDSKYNLKWVSDYCGHIFGEGSEFHKLALQSYFDSMISSFKWELVQKHLKMIKDKWDDMYDAFKNTDFSTLNLTFIKWLEFNLIKHCWPLWSIVIKIKMSLASIGFNELLGNHRK